MILSGRREKTTLKSRVTEQFCLFKPLLLIAIGACLFELLPIDFQHAIAPRLVTYEEVFFSDPRFHSDTVEPSETISIHQVNLRGFRPQPAAITLKN